MSALFSQHVDDPCDGIGSALRLDMANRPLGHGHALEGVVRIVRKAAALSSLPSKPFLPAPFRATMTAPLVDALPIRVQQGCDHAADGEQPKPQREHCFEFHLAGLAHIKARPSIRCGALEQAMNALASILMVCRGYYCLGGSSLPTSRSSLLTSPSDTPIRWAIRSCFKPWLLSSNARLTLAALLGVMSRAPLEGARP